MRLHLGPIPEDLSLDGVWRPIREPRPAIFQLLALPIGFVSAAFVGYMWYGIGLSASFQITVGALVGVLLSFPILIVVHELLHATVHPRLGFSRATVIGFWPAQFLFFAHCSAPLSRDRFLLVFAMPFLVITVLPLVLAFFLPMPEEIVLVAAWFSTWNALFACGDLLAIPLIASQVPRRALVQNRGFLTHWRPA